MNFLSWLVGITVLLTVVLESVAFHRATVCRQEAFRGSFILSTRALLTDPGETEELSILRCGIHVRRRRDKVSWLRNSQVRTFTLDLKGRL